MTPKQFAALKKGDTVRHKCAAEAMTVTDVLPTGGVMVVRYSTATNPNEWWLIGDAGFPVAEVDDPE